MNIGDRVKVIGQDITGVIERVDGYSVSIIDDDSEWEYPESLLEYRVSDVQLLKVFKVYASYVTYLYSTIEATDEGHAENIVDDLDGGHFKQESDYDWKIDSIVDTGEISHA
jgi:hypothetical protein